MPYCNILSIRDNDTHPGRKSLRLPQIDYALPGAYFVTIIANHRLSLFGQINDGRLLLNSAGEMIKSKWLELPRRFNQIVLDYYVVMPNHFHGIIRIMPHSRIDGEQGVGANPVFAPTTTTERSQAAEPTPDIHGSFPGSLGRIIQDFKTGTTNGYIADVREDGWAAFPGRLWQRNYYEKIIRDERMLNEIREYIETNPLSWEFDKENPCRSKQV